MTRGLVCASIAVATILGCGEDNKQCKIGDPDGCDNGQVCEAYSDMSGMHTACFAPTLLKGRISNAQSGQPVAGARVVAIDGDSHAAVGSVSTSDVNGNYSVRVIAPREAGAQKQYTLRVSAAGYQEFPSGIRIAIPIKVSFAMPTAAAIIDGPQDVALVPIPAAPPGSIAGKVSGLQVAGVLVVAEAGGKGWSTVSDGSGDYVIFNVPDGTYSVRGYFVGVNYTPADGVVVAGARRDGVNLASIGPAAGALTGSLDYVAGAPSGVTTAVVLRLRSTREVPPGLSAPAANGPYLIEKIPDGTYDVLAAYPTDGLVKDPDPGISGTGIPTVTIAGNTVDAGQFKVTAPVDMMHPDGNERLSGMPSFTWAAYPSAQFYKIEVFDSQGNPIWVQDHATGTSLGYGGGPLTVGGFYQWRITSYRTTSMGAIPNSMSEDLRGVWQQM